MKLKFCIVLLACSLGLYTSAQNLTGRWQWTIQGSGNDIQSDYLIELDLKQEGNRLYGLRTLYLKNYEDIVVNVEGIIEPGGQVTIASKNVLQNKLPDSILVATNFTYKLQLRSGATNQLDGTFYPREDTAKKKYRLYDPGFYDAIYAHAFSSPFKKLADTLSEKAKQRMGIATPAVAANPVKPTPQPALITDVQSRLTLPWTDISIDLYDNGSVDGDSITLLINNKIIGEHQKLTTRSLHFDLKKEDFADSTSIIMRAENLGSIPPNTALMLITAAGQRYDVRLSSDLKRQAAVLLYRKK